MNEFQKINQELNELIYEWEPRLSLLPVDIISQRRNSQSRTIKQIVGHMVDSASNNIHRMVHMQYQASPLYFPDYANLGNNDRWIAIQNYQEENWYDLVQLWKYANIHFIHVINHINPEKLDNIWINALKNTVSLHDMVINYLSHFKLHLSEINDILGHG